MVNKIINKKAISNIVVSMILILLITISVTILFISIKEMTSQETLASPSHCIDLQAYPPIQTQGVCYNLETKDVEANLIRKNNEVNIKSLEFVIDFKDEFYTDAWVCCEDECDNCKIHEQGTKTYYLKYQDESKIPTKFSLNIEGCLIETKEINNC